MYSSYSVATAVCSIVFPVLATIAVLFRLRARRIQKVKLEWDDYLALLTLVLAIALCMVFLNGALNASIGQDLTTITPEQFSRYQQHIYYAVILAYVSYGVIKLCVVSFYKRIFSVPNFVRAANIMMGVVAVWMVATFFIAVFSAWPISNFWTLGGRYTIDHPAFLFYSTIIDTTLDIAILCMPFPMIPGLNATRQTKIQLIGLFSMGFFCVIAAGLRIYFGYLLSHSGATNAEQVDNAKFSYIAVSNVIWCEIESCCSIIAACLPCIKPILRSTHFLAVPLSKVRSLLQSISQVSAGRSKNTGSSKSKSSKGSSGGSYPLSETGSSKDLIFESKETQTEGVEDGHILVTREVMVDFEDEGYGERGIRLGTVDERDIV